MKLKDIVRCQGYILKILVHRVQRVAVPSDFLLVACARRRLLTHELPQARVRRANALDLIGGFRALDFCDLDQLFDLGWFLTQIQRLLSLLFMDLRKVTDALIIPRLLFQKSIIKSPHFLHLALFSSIIPCLTRIFKCLMDLLSWLIVQ